MKWLLLVPVVGSATAYAIEGGDIVGALVQLADGIGEGFVALTLGFAVGPSGNRPAHSVFSVGGQEFGGVEHGRFAVAIH